MQLVLKKTNKHFIETKLTQKGIIAVEDPVENPGEEPGGPAFPLLFLDQTETWRVDKQFWRPHPSLPLYLISTLTLTQNLIQGKGPGGPPLTFRPNRGRRIEFFFCWNQAPPPPPYLRVWMTDSLTPYLKVSGCGSAGSSEGWLLIFFQFWRLTDIF